MSETDLEEDPYEKHGSESEMEHTPDGELLLTDEGIEMPVFLRGYTGTFRIRTPSVTGDMETSAGGMPDGRFYDGPIAVYPSDGDYNEDIPSGCMAMRTEDHPEMVFEIIDEREDE